MVGVVVFDQCGRGGSPLTASQYSSALTDALSSHGSVDDALADWDQTRTEYGTTLVARGKQMGDVRLNLN